MQRRPITGQAGLVHRAFQVVVQVFHRIQFRRVGRQEAHRDLVRVRRHPVVHRWRLVRRQPIRDQDYLPGRSRDQLVQEDQEHCRGERPLVGHEADGPRVADGRDLVHPEVRPRHRHRRPLSSPGVATPRMVIRRDPDLIRPENLRVVPGRQVFDRRVGSLLPPLDGGRILVTRLARRLLGRVLPAAQVLPDGSLRQVEGELGADQIANRAPSPQGVREAQFLRQVLVDQLANAFGLGIRQGASRAQGSAGATAGQRGQTLGGVGGPPATDGLRADAQKFRQIDRREAQFEAMQGPQTKNLKCLIGQVASIWQRDRHDPAPWFSVAGFLLFYSTPTLVIKQLSCRGNTMTVPRFARCMPGPQSIVSRSNAALNT